MTRIHPHNKKERTMTILTGSALAGRLLHNVIDKDLPWFADRIRRSYPDATPTQVEQIRGEFIQALNAIDSSPAWEGGTLRATIENDERYSGGAKLGEVFSSWLNNRAITDRRAAHEAHLASTVEVQVWKGGKLGKPTRLPRSEINAWIKPGHHIVTESLDVRGRGFDSDFGPSFSVRSLEVGAERDDGTVASKRIVAIGGKRQIQYLIKPRSKTAEASRKTKLRITEIKRQLADADMLRSDEIQALHAELAKLEKTSAP